MTHKQALLDYEALCRIAGGHPHDAGEVLEDIANSMLRTPGAKQARGHLDELIELFYIRGGPSGDSLKAIPQARVIFIRHHLMGEPEEESP